MADLPSQPKPDTATNTTVDISPRTDAMVEQSMANESASVKQETKQLVEALKSRAQREVQGAQQVTLDTYLGAVRKAKETLQGSQTFDPDKIERSMGLIQADAQKNMASVMEELKEMGDRLGDRITDAAQAAWDTFKHDDKSADDKAGKGFGKKD